MRAVLDAEAEIVAKGDACYKAQCHIHEFLQRIAVTHSHTQLHILEVEGQALLSRFEVAFADFQKVLEKIDTNGLVGVVVASGVEEKEAKALVAAGAKHYWDYRDTSLEMLELARDLVRAEYWIGVDAGAITWESADGVTESTV